ncbi:hypothetical protein A2U01_0020012, partial [Trifolium medium]|nr:hypothetical protein [Trifolium medium]
MLDITLKLDEAENWSCFLSMEQGATSSTRGAGRESVLDVGLWWRRGAQLAWR